jgi:hypothetical protein
MEFGTMIPLWMHRERDPGGVTTLHRWLQSSQKGESPITL